MGRTDMFGVVRREVPEHGVKVGCRAPFIAVGLTNPEADTLADALQGLNPDNEYAVIEIVFHRYTKPGGA